MTGNGGGDKDNENGFYKELIFKVGGVEATLNIHTTSLNAIGQNLLLMQKDVDKIVNKTESLDTTIKDHETRIKEIENSSFTLAKAIMSNPKSIAVFVLAVIVELVILVKQTGIV